MRKNKLNKISLKQLYSDLKKVTSKRSSTFGSFKQHFKNVVRKHGKTIAVVGGTTLAVAGTAAAMHYRNEIQNKEEQFHARELAAKATIYQIKRTQEADKKLLDAEKETAKKFDSKNKELEQLAKEKEQLRKEEHAGNTIQIAYLKNQVKNRTKLLQDKEAALQQAIANQEIAFKISVVDNSVNPIHAPPPPPPPPDGFINNNEEVTTRRLTEVTTRRLTDVTINSMKKIDPYKKFLEIINKKDKDIDTTHLYEILNKFKYGYDIAQLLKHPYKQHQVVIINNNKSTTIVYIVIVLLKDGGFNIQYDGENTSSVELDEEIQFINYYNKKINEILHIN